PARGASASPASRDPSTSTGSVPSRKRRRARRRRPRSRLSPDPRRPALHESCRGPYRSGVGTLYLVATPIGNLEDVSPRALRVLQEVHMVACEDTRHTQILLRRHEIRAKHLTSYTEFNHKRQVGVLVGQLDRGWDVALVSDAGTPALSDPGEALVVAAIAAGHTVTPIPGPAAAIAALVASGLPTRAFTFIGFPPKK